MEKEDEEVECHQDEEAKGYMVVDEDADIDESEDGEENDCEIIRKVMHLLM